MARVAGFEDRLGGSDEMFRHMVESVRDYAIFMLDPDGNVTTWNAGAERIKGYTATEIIGRHFSTFYPEADVQAGKPDWELVVASDTGRFEDEGWRVRKDGSQFWANVVITALRDPGGQLSGFAKVTRDLTSRHEAEMARLARQRKEAEAARVLAARAMELEKTKTEFLNLASHELRSPLGVARGYVSLLLDGSLTPNEFAERAPLVANKLARIEALVGEMLETARLDDDQLVLSVTDVDLGRIVHEQVEAIRSSLTPRHHLNLDLPESLPPVQGDADRLSAVAANLLDNAVKYSPGGGRIDVKVTASQHRVFVSVADEGLGIDQDDMPKLFRRFTRLHEKEATNVGGTGLGLFLSREIARRHGGDIIVESRRDEGSRFTLSLPISKNGGVERRRRRFQQ